MNKTCMKKSQVAATAFSAVAVFLLLWLFAPSPAGSSPASPTADISGTELGITYLPLNRQAAAEFGLEVDSAALITSVARGSIAESSGLAEGDIVLGFNGTSLGPDTPLIGLMLQCSLAHGPTDCQVMAEISRDGCSRQVLLGRGGQLVQ